MKNSLLTPSLKRKVYTGAVVFVLLILAMQHYSANLSHRALKKSIGYNSVIIAQELIREIENNISFRIEQLLINSISLSNEKILLQSNRRFERMPDVNRFIEEKDRQWLAAPSEKITPFMSKIIDNNLSGKLRDSIEIKSFYIKEYGYPLFGEVFVTNKYGVNTAQTEKTTDYYQGDEEWWQKAKTNGIHVEKVDYDQSSGIFALSMAVRVEDTSGAFAGVTKAVTNMRDIIRIIDDVKDRDRSRGNSTRQFTLITTEGKIIYSTKKFERFERFDDELMNYLKNDSSLDDTFFTAHTINKKEVMYTHAHIKQLKSPDWILIIEQESDEIFADVYRMQEKLTVITTFIVIILLIVVFYNIFFVLRPIEKLEKAMEQVGQGLLETRVDINKRDEIGRLAESFNKMTEDLKDTTTSKNYLNNIVHSMNDALIVVLQNGAIKSANTSACTMLGYKELELTGEHISKIVAHNDTLSQLSSFDELMKELVVKHKEMNLLRKDGQQTTTLFSGVIVQIEDGGSEGILCLATDISEYKALSEEREKSERKYKRIVENLQEEYFFYSHDLDGVYKYVSPSINNVLGYSQEEFYANSDIHYAVDLLNIEDVQNNQGEQEPSREIEMYHKDGNLRRLEVKEHPVLNSSGEVVAVEGIAHDVTVKKMMEDQLLRSLREKETFLKEIHHRVKNNLQLISSLLYLQSERTKDHNMQQILIESQNRIKSMAKIHEMLYQSRDLSSINMKDYLDDLTRSVYHTFSAKVGVVRLIFDIDNIEVNVDMAIPCGLIINELISNSMKYAFPGNRSGVLEIKFNRHEENNYQLVVRDDGVGFPEDFDIEQTNSLGLHLVSTLSSRQLKGKFNVSGSEGVEVKIEFKMGV